VDGGKIGRGLLRRPDEAKLEIGQALQPPSSRGEAVYVRVVRFTDVTAERVQGLVARIEESEGPPPGVPATGLQLLFDEGQGTAVVLQFFATADDMRAGDEAFSAMDASETPGNRASVDRCELVLERQLSAGV
jgi:hypothetical protein